MTAEQIIKALDCCIGDEDGRNCFDCPFYEIVDCQSPMYVEAIDIIKRQKAEIERLKGWERLLKAEKHSLIEAEAIKKFAEKVISYCENIIGEHWNTISAPVSWADAYEGFIDDINNLVKEMVGED